MIHEHTREEVLLTIDHVSLSFGETIVLNDVNAVVKDVRRPGMTQGQVVGFLGPSGRGKTQLFRILAGLNPPTSGTVRVGPEQRPVRLGDAGVVDQHYSLFDHMDVGENLVIAGRLAGMSKPDAEARGRDLLKRFQLDTKWYEYPQKLSGGQRQRVAIAQQLMCLRGFLFMDEPFSGLDPNMKSRACDLIMEVAQMDEKLTIVVITHDIESAITISDTLWLLGHGEDPAKGSCIRKEYDLVSAGLAWDPEVTHKPEFRSLVSEITTAFRSL